MYPVSAQGIDERTINVHYYYYIHLSIREGQLSNGNTPVIMLNWTGQTSLHMCTIFGEVTIPIWVCPQVVNNGRASRCGGSSIC